MVGGKSRLYIGRYSENEIWLSVCRMYLVCWILDFNSFISKPLQQLSNDSTVDNECAQWNEISLFAK